MANAKTTALTENTAPLAGDIYYMVDDPSGTPLGQKILAGNTVKAIYASVGMMLNGYIDVTVASNNLTVALKTLAGNNPSATDFVNIRIGNTVRQITAALSVTKNAGTNWCNAGGAALATKEVDYFVYIGYNATDGVVIGFSRIPGATTYGDFSATTTNEKYCAISTITNAASTDEYQVVGRFAATLSAGAGYTWSVPAFTPINLIQRPIYETRWLDWAPTYSASGSMTFTSVSTTFAKYRLGYSTSETLLNASGTTGGTASDSLIATIPIAPIIASAMAGAAITRDATSGNGTVGTGFYNSTNGIYVRKADATNYGLGTGRIMYFSGRYQF